MNFKKCFAVGAILACTALSACNGNTPAEKSAVQKIIEEAEKMDFKDVCRKAIEESKGKKLSGVGNSSRGSTALPIFVDYLKTIDSTYNATVDWQQPKNNKIFDQLTADSKKATGTFFTVLIQDGNQIESKMVKRGVLDTFIPKEWAKANNINRSEYKGYLPLQTLNKVFMINNTGTKTFDNVWDFVAPNEHGLYMDIDSEIVGKNFLYMLTQEKYADMMKDAYDKLSATDKALYTTDIEALASTATEYGLSANGKYSLAWIKRWVESYNAKTDDGPICNELVQASASDQFGLLVYSKLRSINESTDVSKKNITIAAYQQGNSLYNNVKYEGIGGFGYCHYMFVPDNSYLPWTACAFNAFLTIVNEDKTADKDKVAGFSAWGKDMGGYSSNPEVLELNEKVYKHSKGGYETDAEGHEINSFDCKNDRGYNWWKSTGKLVIEDPEYCSSVAFTVGSWIETLTKYVA